MQLERLRDLGMLPPQVIAHPPGRDGVADRHVPPRERAEQRLRQHGEHDVEAEFEYRKGEHDQVECRWRHFDFGGQRGRNGADDDECGHVKHRVRHDAREGDDHLRGIVHAEEHRRAEHGRGKERAAGDHVDDQEPERDRRGADQAGDEPLAQDPGQLHRFPPPDGRPSANIRRLADPGRKPGVRVNWARPNPEEIMTVSRSLVFPLCLVAGPLLVIVAGTLHPDLAGDGAAQLTTIAQCRAWRAIHWTFLFSFPLALTGLVGVARIHAGSSGENAVRAGLITATFAYTAWMVIVAFMAGSGWALAQVFTQADPGMTATRAVFVYDMIHPFALATQRVAGFALGLSTCLFGWGVVDGKALPHWVGTSGMGAGAVAMAFALGFPENTKADQAAFVLPVLWQMVTGAVLLARANAHDAPRPTVGGVRAA